MVNFISRVLKILSWSLFLPSSTVNRIRSAKKLWFHPIFVTKFCFWCLLAIRDSYFGPRWCRSVCFGHASLRARASGSTQQALNAYNMQCLAPSLDTLRKQGCCSVPFSWSENGLLVCPQEHGSELWTLYNPHRVIFLLIYFYWRQLAGLIPCPRWRLLLIPSLPNSMDCKKLRALPQVHDFEHRIRKRTFFCLLSFRYTAFCSYSLFVKTADSSMFPTISQSDMAWQRTARCMRLLWLFSLFTPVLFRGSFHHLIIMVA